MIEGDSVGGGLKRRRRAAWRYRRRRIIIMSMPFATWRACVQQERERSVAE
jgi:hypothetical protein